MKNRLSLPARVIVAVASLAMIAVLYLPIWQIELTAPQYPEGLVLKIYANRIGGAVDIINGLNHYIGMETLHTSDFMEFTVLPYIIGGLLAIGFLVALVNRKRFFYVWFTLFLFIAIISMIDFYRWEYNYDHHLNPDAPIKVPGMSYQPPLIGYKQLLNFTAYSIPDSGGWIFIGVGGLLLAALILEWKLSKKMKTGFPRAVTMILLLLGVISFAACHPGPEPIHYGQDNCDYCKMEILDKKFGAEILTAKGKTYKFDDMHCVLAFLRANTVYKKDIASVYFTDFAGDNRFIKAGESFLLKSDRTHTPMGGDIVAFKEVDSAKKYGQELNAQMIKWGDLYK